MRPQSNRHDNHDHDNHTTACFCIKEYHIIVVCRLR